MTAPGNRPALLQSPEPDPAPTRPGWEVPPGATDVHAHIFAPAGSVPEVPDPLKLPPAAGLDAYVAMLDAVGLDRCVLVQPDNYGADNTVMLDAIARLGHRARGVAGVTPDVTDADLARLHRGGVRGLRLSDMSRHCLGLRHLTDVAGRIADLGWHVALLIGPEQIDELTPVLRDLPCPVVIDHVARFQATRGVDDPALGHLLRLAALGHVWIKVSAVEFLCAGTRDEALDPIVARLADATDRLLWGTDWPHGSVTFTGAPMPNDGRLLDMAARWFPDPDARRRVLCTNPEALYDFPAVVGEKEIP